MVLDWKLALDEIGDLRDIDLQHDWSTDLPEEQLLDNPETFVRRQRQAEIQHGGDGGEDIRADALNTGQRVAFQYIVEYFRRRISGAVDAPSNTIVMGTAGVGKSYLIRALETAIWHLATGHDEYPNVRTAIKLAAYTGKAAFQVGGVTIHSLLSIRNARPNHCESCNAISKIHTSSLSMR